MKRGYIFLLLSIFLFSCGENKQEGNTTFKRIPIEYRKASSIKLSEFVDSICIVPLETNTENLIGEYKIYYNDSKLYKKRNYENGIAKGNFITYFPSGKIMTKGVYKNGENNGTYTSYSEDGKIVKNANMNNGVVDVTITYYDSNGNKKNQSLVGKGFDNYDKDFSNDYSTYESISTKIY